MRNTNWIFSLAFMCAFALQVKAAPRATPRELIDQLGADGNSLAASAELSRRFTESRSEIMAGLKHSNPKVRSKVILLLLSRRNPAYFSEVRPLIHDTNPRVRAQVLNFTAGIMGQAGKEVLRIGLKDSDPANRSSAVRSLGLMGGPDELSLLNSLVDTSTDTVMVGTAVLVLASKGEKRVRAKVIELLASATGFGRTDLIEALGYVGKAEDLILLESIANSTHENQFIRVDAKRAITRLTFQLKGASEKQVEILEALRSDDLLKRRWACGELIRLGDKASIAILKKIASDPNHPGAAEASDALSANKDRIQE